MPTVTPKTAKQAPPYERKTVKVRNRNFVNNVQAPLPKTRVKIASLRMTDHKFLMMTIMMMTMMMMMMMMMMLMIMMLMIASRETNLPVVGSVG